MSKASILQKPKKLKREPIAIVGVGGILPDANSAEEFWQNVVNGRNSIRDISPNRWDPELYYDPDRNASDKTYAKIGAFIDNFEFQGLHYRIPPTTADQMDITQKYALYAAKEALEDANYKSEAFPNESTAIIIGNSAGGEIKNTFNFRIHFPEIVKSLQRTEKFKKMNNEEQTQFIKDLEKEYKRDLLEITEDSMPGELPNIIAGRIAQVFNLRGMNITSDAACASSLAAIDVAFKGLVAHEYDAAVVGGSDRSMDPSTYVKFSKIGALSADGSFPFDAKANGFVMGEGAAMFVLKRLSDALKSKDKIYALVLGIGASSDGKGKGITAPNPIGQELAVRRAYELAGIKPNDVQMIEAHGTSTSVGDKVEVTTLEKVFKEFGVKPQSVKLGSIKSQIGHLKSAAGSAAILKMALALHHKTMPPSINFSNPNPNIDWKTSPFVVNQQSIPWEVPPGTPRRAGVSSFGFGGTNFHVILEEYDPTRDYLSSVQEIYVADPSSNYTSDHTPLDWKSYSERNQELEKEPIILSANTSDELISALKDLPNKIPGQTITTNQNSEPLLNILEKVNFNQSSKYRVGLAVPEIGEVNRYVQLAVGAIEDQARQGVARARGIYVSDGLPSGKVAFLFPGQGSQYADMFYDLSLKYQIVKETIDEADEILKDRLDKPLSTYLFSNGRDPKQVEEDLRQTQITQPAMLTADIALFRLMKEFGLKPDMVAGHSLGEYAALVAAEVLSFRDALIAVAIRGKAMSTVDAKDKGTMASISGTLEEVEDILSSVKGYVIAANKNSISQTVISGNTDAVHAAIKEFESRGMNAIPLAVSAAFHTKIVEPAGEPLAEYLNSITFNKPIVPITSNVTGKFFPEDPKKIRDLLKKQVGSAVEWTKQVQTMHKADGKIFFEVGPKRALASFVSDILGEKEVLTVVCNHPKKGGIVSFNEAISAAAALGLPVNRFSSTSEVFTPEFRWPQNGQIRSEIHKQIVTQQQYQAPVSVQTPQMQQDMFREFMNQTLGYLQSDAGKIQKLGLNLDNIVITGIGVGLPGKHKEVFDEENFERILRGENLIDKVGDEKLKQQLEKNIRRLIKKSGSEPIFHTPTNISEVINLAGQKGKFDFVEEFQLGQDIADTYDVATELAIAAGLIALRDAGIPLVRSYRKTTTGSYLPGPWVLPEELQDDTGIVFASAFPGYDQFAAEIREFSKKKFNENSKKLLNDLYSEISRKVSSPKEKGELLKKIEKELSDLEKEENNYIFNRKLLLNVLSMGHSQFAQLIRARGPNTQVNAACASTTQAIGVAMDWIRSGRCKRVVVISGDDISNENLFEWLGTGFLASGAATTKAKVEEAALPFDRRRHGMIIGMGASSLVLETESEAQRRGVEPLVELIGSYYANSSFHGTRLDQQHVSESVQEFMRRVYQSHGLTPQEISQSMMFMSHETYTPRRGGSAGAEIQALRETFGDAAANIIIANTKGFTGHAMGAGIEDVVAIKALQEGKVPPIANFKEGDEELGPLRLSKGENVNVTYSLRLAAGFGSQIALALFKKRTSSRNRFSSQYDMWIDSIGGSKSDLNMVGKTLRLKDTGSPMITNPIKSSYQPVPYTPVVQTTPVQTMPVSQPATKTTAQRLPTSQPVAKQTVRSSGSSLQKDQVLKEIIDLVADKTGYPQDMLDPNLDMEADLGIDTVKTAEMVGLIREKYNIPRVDDMEIGDYSTLSKIADFVIDQTGSSTGVESTPTITETKTKITPLKQVGTSTLDRDEVLNSIIDIVAEKTGYPKDMLDPNLEMETDLGIDTVKQAELVGLIREKYSIERAEDMQIADYPTMSRIADFVLEQTSEQPRKEADVQAKRSSQTMKKPEQVVPKQETSQPQAVEKSRLDTVISVLSDMSGYPASLIDETISIRTDLGFDDTRVKELLNTLSSKLDVSKRTDFENINYISDLFESGSVNTPRNEPATVNKVEVKQIETRTAQITEEKSTSVIADANIGEVRDRIMGIISEKTGYPKDLLDPDLDMEADLGIDTVKTAEIFGYAREQFGVAKIDEMNIADYNTINKISELIHSNMGTATKEEIGSEASSIATKLVTHRYTIKSNSLPINDNHTSSYPGFIIGKENKTFTTLGEKVNYQIHPNIKSIGSLKEKTNIILVNPLETSIGSITALFEWIKSELTNLASLSLAVKSNKPTIHSLTPLQGAIGGIFKAIAMEFPEISSKIVVYETTKQLEKEITNVEGGEFVYQNNERQIVALHEEDLPESNWTLDENDVLLASGGAQGITYEIVKKITSKNSTIILLGRTEVRHDAELIANMNEDQLKKRKSELLEEMKKETDKVTPVMLEKEWSKYTKSSQVWKSVQELKDLGAKVHYYSIDISNDKKVTETFKEIYKTISGKKITHFIHGAGLEISRATKTKSSEEFDLVYGVKVRGFENIWSNLEIKSIKRLITFSSVAGRFGNATQVDYSAANEYLSKKCAQLRDEGVKATSIDYSVWDEVGMGTRGSTMQVLSSIGITPIPVDQGVQRTIQEIEHGNEIEVVISGELGELSKKTPWYEKTHPSIMIDDINEHTKTATRTLSLKKDKYLDDHRIEGKAVLPGVMGLETIAEVSKEFTNQLVQSMSNVKFKSPVKLPRDNDLEIVISSGNEQNYSLRSKFLGPDGKQLGDLREHFESQIIHGQRIPGYPGIDGKLLKQLSKQIIYPKSEIYELFFHGESYQVLGNVNSLTPTTILVEFDLPSKTMFDKPVNLEINPLTLEAAFQAAGLHLMLTKGEMALPSGILNVVWFNHDMKPKYLKATYLGSSETNSFYDIDILDKNGIVITKVKSFDSIHTGKINKPNVEIEDDNILNEAKYLTGQVGKDIFSIETECLIDVSDDFITGFLRENEQARYNGLKIAKKRTEWLAGRIAAKLALSYYLSVPLKDIEIQKDENRSPFVVINKQKTDVSISHSHGLALGVAGERTIDIDTVEKREAGFLSEAFSKDEITSLNIELKDVEKVTRLWTMKEAHLKRMRIGLKTDLHKVKISDLDNLSGTVTSEQGKSKVWTMSNSNWAISFAVSP